MPKKPSSFTNYVSQSSPLWSSPQEGGFFFFFFFSLLHSPNITKQQSEQSKKKLTVPHSETVKAEPSASQPIISAISWIRAFVSRALASLERSWESLARRQGCAEVWMLRGKEGEEDEGDMLKEGRRGGCCVESEWELSH